MHNKQINRRRVDNCIYNIIIEDIKKKKLHNNIGKEQNLENDIIISFVNNKICIDIMILDNVYQNKSLINIRCNYRLDHLQAAHYISTLGFNSHLVIIDQHTLASFTFSSFTLIIVMTLKHNIENSIYNYIIRILKHCNLDIYIRHFANNLYRFIDIKVHIREENNINIDIDKEQEKIEHTRCIDNIDLVNTLHLERGQSISTTEMHISILEHFAHDKTAKNCHINIVIILASSVSIIEDIDDKHYFFNIITVIVLVILVINIILFEDSIISNNRTMDIFINIIISSSSSRRVSTSLPVIIINIVITNVIVNNYSYIIIPLDIINSSISSKCTMHIYIIIIIIIITSSSSRINIFLQLIINIFINNVIVINYSNNDIQHFTNNIINNIIDIVNIIIKNLLFIIKTIITNLYWNISIIITVIIQYNLIIDIEHNNIYNIKINISYNETVAQIYINIINLVITHTINNKVDLENDITIILAYTGFIITELFQTFNGTLIPTYKFIIILYLFKPIICTLNINNMDAVNIKYVITDPLHHKVRHHRYIQNIDDIRRRCTLHLGDALTRMHQHHGYIEGIADIKDRCRECIDSIATSARPMTSAERRRGCITDCITCIDEMQTSMTSNGHK